MIINTISRATTTAKTLPFLRLVALAFLSCSILPVVNSLSFSKYNNNNNHNNNNHNNMKHLLHYRTNLPQLPASSPHNIHPNNDNHPNREIVLFVHGLDSSSHTWRDVLDIMTPSTTTTTASASASASKDNPNHKNVCCYAIDLRGNGKSPLQDPKEFCIHNIVQDIYQFIHNVIWDNNNDDTDNNTDNNTDINPKIILVGHSMGARVASCFAAQYPNYIKALIMEDMDVRSRSMDTNPVPMNYFEIQNFRQKYPFFSSLDHVTKVLLEAGYPNVMIQKWIRDGRVRKEYPPNEKHDNDSDNNNKDEDDDCYYWTDVNPEMRYLAYQHIMCTQDGINAWNTIAQSNNNNNNNPFPCHVWVAGIGSACEEDNINFMKDIMKDRMILHRFPEATHSIHRTAQKEFLHLLQNIINE